MGPAHSTVTRLALALLSCVGCGARTGIRLDAPRDGGPGPLTDSPSDAVDTGAPDDRPEEGTPDPPKPLSPVSTGYVTSRRPMLRWALAPGTSGVRLQLCRNRACRDALIELDVADTTFTPVQELSPGVWYWRLRGRR